MLYYIDGPDRGRTWISLAEQDEFLNARNGPTLERETAGPESEIPVILGPMIAQ